MMLKEKVAVITGGGRGLGRAIAVAMSKAGAHVTIVSRSMNELSDVATTIRDHGGSVLEIQGDLTNTQFIQEMVTKTTETFSTVDILVNNAAVIGPPTILSIPDTEEWHQTLNINLIGAYQVTLSVLPVMIRQRNGKIINITSGLGQRPFPRFCAYSVSKAGLIQLTRSLSVELKDHNIQVNAIDPGVMNTQMQSDIRQFDETTLGSEVYQLFKMRYEEGMLKDPFEIAPLAVFLASENANHLTGHIGNFDYYSSYGFQRNM